MLSCHDIFVKTTAKNQKAKESEDTKERPKAKKPRQENCGGGDDDRQYQKIWRNIRNGGDEMERAVISLENKWC